GRNDHGSRQLGREWYESWLGPDCELFSRKVTGDMPSFISPDQMDDLPQLRFSAKTAPQSGKSHEPPGKVECAGQKSPRIPHQSPAAGNASEYRPVPPCGPSPRNRISADR